MALARHLARKLNASFPSLPQESARDYLRDPSIRVIHLKPTFVFYRNP